MCFSFFIASYIYNGYSYVAIGLCLLCSEIAYYAFWNCSNFAPISYARFYATPQSIMLVIANTQFNIHFYKAHLFMNLQLPLHTALILICHMPVV